MATVVAPRGGEGTAMEGFCNEGSLLLPTTKHILSVLWEQLRLLVQIIYCVFTSVFQLFRFEVHLRITDETSQHIQHMGTAANPSDSFLFTSLFDGENGVMVGGSSPLSNFCADVADPFTGKSTAEALLSSLRADDLCCGLVDDLVSGTTSTEDIFLEHHSSWKMGFPQDWNIFVSNSDGSTLSDVCHTSNEKVFKREISEDKVKPDASEEEQSYQSTCEEDPNVAEFDSEKSEALWESLSTSIHPYNPLIFSACIITNKNMRNGKSEVNDSSDTDSMSVTVHQEMLGTQGLSWVRRSDSESSWSSSDGSSPDLDEESEKLLELFTSADPYNPLFFTACRESSTPAQTTTATASLPVPPTASETEEKISLGSSADDEEEQLWKSLCQEDDPYHPLNFKACLQSSPTIKLQSGKGPKAPGVQHVENPDTKEKKCEKKSDTPKESAATRSSTPEKCLVLWKKPSQAPKSLQNEKQINTAFKKVRFSPVIQVHVMRSWPHARWASRKGHWEELARDRDRFQNRIRQTGDAIGFCFSQQHREKMQSYLAVALK